MCGRLSSQLDIDSSKLLHLFQDENVQEKFGFNSYTFSSMVIPNTYEVFSNVSENKLIEFIASKYKVFEFRKVAKAKALGYNQSEITTLASIVQMEQQIKFDEHSKIAGLYINRLKSNMKLQADPTVKFAFENAQFKKIVLQTFGGRDSGIILINIKVCHQDRFVLLIQELLMQF